MRTLKSGKIQKKTAVITLHNENIIDAENNIAIALLLGAYNPLRKHSPNEMPINLDKLKELQNEFDSIISEIKHEMKVNILDVERF